MRTKEVKKQLNKKAQKRKIEQKTEQIKFCPFSPIVGCKEHHCELWLSSVYSTENIIQKGRCSIRFIAEKNSDGLLPV